MREAIKIITALILTTFIVFEGLIVTDRALADITGREPMYIHVSAQISGFSDYITSVVKGL